MVIKRAKQPTNIIWENRENGEKRRRRGLIAVTIFMILFGVFYFVMATFYMQLRVGLEVLTAPTSVSCTKLYQNTPFSVLRENAQLQSRTLEAQYYDAVEGSFSVPLNEGLPRDGSYQCYCIYAEMT